jgi:hypothetical protein
MRLDRKETRMKTISIPNGGRVVRESQYAWRVYAPDGRDVGLFKTRTQAFAKAEHWDKWDALASLQDIALVMIPFTTCLVLGTIASLTTGKLAVPTTKEIEDAAAKDVVYMCLLRILKAVYSKNDTTREPTVL